MLSLGLQTKMIMEGMFGNLFTCITIATVAFIFASACCFSLCTRWMRILIPWITVPYYHWALRDIHSLAYTQHIRHYCKADMHVWVSFQAIHNATGQLEQLCTICEQKIADMFFWNVRVYQAEQAQKSMWCDERWMPISHIWWERGLYKELSVPSS